MHALRLLRNLLPSTSPFLSFDICLRSRFATRRGLTPRYHTNVLSFTTKMAPESAVGSSSEQSSGSSSRQTQLLSISSQVFGGFQGADALEDWQPSQDEHSLAPLVQAAQKLRTGNIPVAFPTETVYGLGADATRSEAVKGIYHAKGRPSDNPLIIHVCDLSMLRDLLAPSYSSLANGSSPPIIPPIYAPLIQRFWPGPLTILLRNPTPSKLAPEVTSSLSTFGVRMPDSPLALSLIKLAGVFIAAPSANASTRPSCTTAQHVLEDLNGKIELILDGGPCQVGVESTIVDGLSSPPCILRPGGISIEQVRECAGWEGVVKAYRDKEQDSDDDASPRAPGMKYKHYSPRAKVVLYEALRIADQRQTVMRAKGIPLGAWRMLAVKERKIRYLGLETLDPQDPFKIGLITTKYWTGWAGLESSKWADEEQVQPEEDAVQWNVFATASTQTQTGMEVQSMELWCSWETHVANVVKVELGSDVKNIAQGLFSALRELDQRGVSVIYVEGIEDEGDIAAAVMNRLRKAATVIEKPRQHHGN